MQIETCPECGVPLYVSLEHEWRNSGLIIQKRDRRHILSLIENYNVVGLLKQVEDILGTSIERIILTTRRRASKAYMEKLWPDPLKEMVWRKEIDVEPLTRLLFTIAHSLGYGRFELVDFRYEQDDEDYIVIRMYNPYSIVLGISDPVAAFESLIGREIGATYEKIDEDVYEVRMFAAKHPQVFKGRLQMKTFDSAEGDIELEACRCGAPRALKAFRWDLENGVITNVKTGRRMIFFAPTVLEAIFSELENELGASIPGAVIQAQRRLTLSGLYPFNEKTDGAVLRKQLALRGLGEIRDFSLDKDRLSVSARNVPINLLMVGLAQGIFEIANKAKSEVEWALSDSGDLQVEVKRASA